MQHCRHLARPRLPLASRDAIADGRGDGSTSFTAGRLLHEAARLSARAAASPFHSFGRIAGPRPYQLVPLMIALKLDQVRILIADDVVIGNTIKPCFIAREFATDTDGEQRGRRDGPCPAPAAFL